MSRGEQNTHRRAVQSRTILLYGGGDNGRPMADRVTFFPAHLFCAAAPLFWRLFQSHFRSLLQTKKKRKYKAQKKRLAAETARGQHLRRAGATISQRPRPTSGRVTNRSTASQTAGSRRFILTHQRRPQWRCHPLGCPVSRYPALAALARTWKKEEKETEKQEAITGTRIPPIGRR